MGRLADNGKPDDRVGMKKARLSENSFPEQLRCNKLGPAAAEGLILGF